MMASVVPKGAAGFEKAFHIVGEQSGNNKMSKENLSPLKINEKLRSLSYVTPLNARLDQMKSRLQDLMFNDGFTSQRQNGPDWQAESQSSLQPNHLMMESQSKLMQD